MAARDDSARAGRHDDEVKVLSTQISFLEEEIAVLRRRLADSPMQSRLLEERLRETEASLASVTGQNERLAGTLREARDQIVALKEEVDRLAQPPSGFGVFLAACDDSTADVFTGGRKMRVSVSPSIELSELRPGQEVVLNEALNVVDRPGLRDDRRGRHAQGGPRGRRAGAGHLACGRGADRPAGRAADLRRAAAGRGQPAARAAVRLRVRAHPQGRGGRADPGGSPGHQLLRDRRPVRPDRADQGRDRAALPAR